MRAFVKATNGVFANLNFYMAWEGFNAMGYNVTCFEEKDIDTLDITVDTPVFAGVTVFRKVIDKLGVDYPPFNCYPEELKTFYGRTLHRSTLGEEKAKFAKDNIPRFVKPVLPKQFIGAVWKSIINLIPLAKIPDTAEVWVCEPINILSEFRVYVQDGEIIGVKHYYGDWSIVPYKEYLDFPIKAYKSAPVAYGIDIAMVDYGKEDWMDKPNYKEIVLEVNDGCNLGNYGIDSIHYGEMIVSRWFEIMGASKKDSIMKSYAEEIRKSVSESDIDNFMKKPTTI